MTFVRVILRLSLLLQSTQTPFLAVSLETLVMTSLAERVAEPFETLVETITRGSASRLNVLSISLVSYS